MSANELICPVCQSFDVSELIEILQVPVHCNLLWFTRSEAVGAPRDDIRLSFCRYCGHLFNAAFNPALMEYTQAYENSLHFSPRFQSYAESLAADLVSRYDLRGKDIIELGCGQGDFLRLLCRLGNNRGTGFDPSYSPVPEGSEDTEQITFIQDFYSDRYAAYQADLVCCRHVLEHIQYPRDFLAGVYRPLDNQHRTVLFFEVPNVMYTLKDLGIWDLIYEHCSYFSRNSLAHLFRLSGFDVYRLGETYEGQFLTIEAFLVDETRSNPAGQPENDLAQIVSLVDSFANRYQEKKRFWQLHLAQLAEKGKRVVVWGVGSKGVTFLNVLRTRGQIEYVVDINPRKQGMYTTGTGQKIVAPEFLKSYQPDVIIIMNPIYQTEIQQIVAGLGFTPQFLNAS